MNEAHKGAGQQYIQRRHHCPACIRQPNEELVISGGGRPTRTTPSVTLAVSESLVCAFDSCFGC